MKNIFISLSAVLVFAGAVAQTTVPQTPRHLDPTVVSIGKELPRGSVVSHDSRADAVRGTYGVSKYLQPLDEWTRTETAEAVTYKTRFKIPFQWIDRRQFLYVGRTTGSFDVVINGSLAAYSQTGSTPGEFDITDASREGANELEIVIYKDPAARKLENSRPPQEPRLEGEVYILSQPGIRVRDVAISTRMEGTSGLLELGVILKSHKLNPHDYTVWWELLNPAGEIMAEGRRDARLDMRREDTVRFFANIPRVAPWSHEEPRLYTLFIKTQNEGRFREYLAFRIGFRSFDMLDAADGKGVGPDGAGGPTLLLNGRLLPVAMREFTPGDDMAAARASIARMHSRGILGLMLRGAPPSREFFALCDSMGIYVACRADIDTRLSGDSRKVGGNPSNDPAWEGAYLDRTMAMYHTSKNYPSVAMFSLGERSANGYNLYESYLALKALEPHRPVVYADGGGEWNTDFAGHLTEPDAVMVDVAREFSGIAGNVGFGDSGHDVAAGRFVVENRRIFTPLAGEVHYRVLVGRKVVSSGMVPVDIPPSGDAAVTVPITGVKEGKAYTVALDLVAERPDGGYLPPSDPDLKVYRRLDLPLSPAARIVVDSAEFNSDK